MKIFIGLVTHKSTRYANSGGDHGLLARLVENLENQGLEVTHQVCSENLFADKEFELTSEMARETVIGEIRIESRWLRFIGQSQAKVRVREIARIAAFFKNYRANSNTQSLRRLLNIEYAHVHLYRSALDSGADWVLILEDDAASDNVEDLGHGLLSIAKSSTATKLVNLSASFPLQKLGLLPLLTPDPRIVWSGTSARIAYQCNIPATNTVCAVLFRSDFLGQIVADFDSMPRRPVVPIDWKLNVSLMNLWESGAISENECLFIEPAPVVQRSMHETILEPVTPF